MSTTRLVCIGDSFTEGMSDELRPDGNYRGWADRVAHALATHVAVSNDAIEYANLAVRGKLLDQVVDQQVDLAASLDPTITTFHAGPNDVLRRGTDLLDLFRRYDAAVERVSSSADRVVVFTSIGRTGGSGRLAAFLAGRFARFNENVRESARRHDAQVVDLEPIEALTDRRLWHSDRLHLNAEGHRRVAAAVLENLDVQDDRLLGGPPGWWRELLPLKAPASRRHERSADIAWAREHLVPWVGRRLRGVSSGDGRVAKDAFLRRVGVDHS